MDQVGAFATLMVREAKKRALAEFQAASWVAFIFFLTSCVSIQLPLSAETVRTFTHCS